jgi:hypothetical protein
MIHIDFFHQTLRYNFEVIILGYWESRDLSRSFLRFNHPSFIVRFESDNEQEVACVRQSKAACTPPPTLVMQDLTSIYVIHTN